MRCHHVVDEKTGERVYIPVCWGSVVYGAHYCTCYPVKPTSAEDKKGKEIRELEKENSRLRRIIEKLINKNESIKPLQNESERTNSSININLLSF